MHFFLVQKSPRHLLRKKVKFNKTVGVQNENALILSSPLEGMITFRLRQVIKKCPFIHQTDQLAHWFCVCSYTFCHYIVLLGSSSNIFLSVVAFLLLPDNTAERWQLFCPCPLNWRKNPYPQLLLEQDSLAV